MQLAVVAVAGRHTRGPECEAVEAHHTSVAEVGVVQMQVQGIQDAVVGEDMLAFLHAVVAAEQGEEGSPALVPSRVVQLQARLVVVQMSSM